MSLPLLITFLVYLPLLKNGFINWDDPVFVEENPHIRNFNWDYLYWMFTTLHEGNWSPMTWLSFALDYQLGGLDPWIYHLDSLVLHGVNTLLVFLLSLRILSLSRADHGESETFKWNLFACASLTAFLFGIHPLHVEPVAWITDRIDLLCTFFFLAALIFYLDYASQPKPMKWKYWASLLFFFAALMSKAMALSFPAVLLLLDAWPCGRLRGQKRKIILEKLPFVAGALVLFGITVVARATAGSLADLAIVPLDFRLMNAFHSIIFYLCKMAAPTALTPLYPLHLKDVFSMGYCLSALIVTAATAYLLLFRQKWPALTATWFYYLITLAPALGILQVGSQAVADRYFYLPGIGFFLLFSTFLVEKVRSKGLLVPLTLILGIALGYGSFRQEEIWKDSITLWEHTLKTLPRNSIITYTLLGDAYLNQNKWSDASVILDHAVSLNPSFTYPHNGKGKMFLELGDWKRAAEEFSDSIRLDPQKAWPWCHWGIASEKIGLRDSALKEIQNALQLEGDDAWLHCHLGSDYFQYGLKEAALAETLEAAKIDPHFAEAYDQLGTLFNDLAQPENSVEEFKKAVTLEPANADYQLHLARAYLLLGKPREALVLYQKGFR